MENKMPRFTFNEQQAFDTLMALGLTVFVWLQLSVPRFIGRDVGGVLGTGRGNFPPAAGPFLLRHETPGIGIYALAALCLLPLVVRRHWPLIVLTVVTIAAAVFERVSHVPTITVFGPLIALYTVATVYDRRRVITAAVVTATVLLVTSLPSFFDERWFASLIRVVGMVAAAAAIGDSARNRAAYIAEVERRAEEAEARSEEEARRRVDEERLRIARELHDITAHSMSVIAVQSGMAAHVIEKDPEAARHALEDIRTTSKQGLQELRSVLGVMRESSESNAPLAPTPGLARLPELIRVAEDAGFDVDLDTEGDLASLPQLVDSSAYRIIQEALTNAIRHAKPSEVRVAVRNEDDTLAIEVVNGGVTAPAAEHTAGHGVAGMRERTMALGGSFHAGPLPGDRWWVAVTLPTTGRQS